MPLSRRLDAD